MKCKYKINAYCAECNRLITVSKVFTSKDDLIKHWDEIVVMTPLVLFKDVPGSKCICIDKIKKEPNLKLRFKIVEIQPSGMEVEKELRDVLPESKFKNMN